MTSLDFLSRKKGVEKYNYKYIKYENKYPARLIIKDKESKLNHFSICVFFLEKRTHIIMKNKKIIHPFRLDYV